MLKHRNLTMERIHEKKQIIADKNLELRYINDIMKVDVIVKQNFVDDLRAELNTGGLNPDEYLTARFAIPEVFVSSTSMQNGQPRNLYQAPVDLGAQPLRFEKDGKTIHKLRPVEAYVVDDQGNRIDSGVNNPAANIRTGQRWQLQPGAPGLAEMSVNLGDLANTPQGDLVIDPSMEFGAPNVATKDSRLENGSSTQHGGDTTIKLLNNDHAVFAFDVSSLPSDVVIVDAKLNLFISANSLSQGADLKMYNVINHDWSEASVDWFEYESGNPWDTAGGDFSLNNSSDISTVPSTLNLSWAAIDLTSPFKFRYDNNDIALIRDRGFLMKFENDPDGSFTFISKDNDDATSLRWSVDVTYFEAEGIPQTEYYAPILKTKDGNPSVEEDRWFPIGSYYNILATTADNPTGSWISIEGLANKDYGDLYNHFMMLTYIDPRNKRTEDAVSEDIVVQDYVDMLNTMDSVATSSIDYHMLPVITHWLKEPNLVDENFAHNISFTEEPLPWDLFSMPSYYPDSFSWDNEKQEVADVVTTIKNHSRTLGWHLGDEPYGGNGATQEENDADGDGVSFPDFRQYLHDQLQWYIDQSIAPNDTVQPYYVDLRAWGNYFAGTNTDNTVDPVSSDWLDDLDIVDYIMDSSTYNSDIMNLTGANADPRTGNHPWQDGVLRAKSAMKFAVFADDPDDGLPNDPNNDFPPKGYIRFIQSKDIGNNPEYSLDEEGTGFERINLEKHRYLAYSSWVMGGQGLMFFRMDAGIDTVQSEEEQQTIYEGQKWLEKDVFDNVSISSDEDVGINTLLAREADAMKDWLMDEPADDIPAYIFDSEGNDRVRFILRRNQWGTDNRILLLFCNFANDDQYHTTYVYFPDHTITSSPEKVNSDLRGTYSIENDGHTVRFDPHTGDQYIDSPDVYGSAVFLTLSQ